jgi:TDG/mug DNA glycosylase family protein
METLKDYIDFNLTLLSIGLNPSTISVERGYYFANPRNRFWSALNASDLVSESLKPSEVSQDILFEKYKIGFTDVAKRHSSMGKDMVAADFKMYAPILERIIIKYQPKICWFHGKVAITKFLQYGALNKNIIGKGERIDWGLQSFKINSSLVFVTPNPSPANAAYSLDVLIDWYNKLKLLDCDRVK